MSDPDFTRGAGPSPLFLREEELRRGWRTLERAARGLSALDDGPLARAGLGGAHGRAIAAIAAEPGLDVSSLIAALGVAKQSLHRTLRDLTDGGFVRVEPGRRDRRRRHLSLTERGAALEEKLWAVKREHIATAFREAGAEAVAGHGAVLARLLRAAERRRP